MAPNAGPGPSPPSSPDRRPPSPRRSRQACPCEGRAPAARLRRLPARPVASGTAGS